MCSTLTLTKGNLENVRDWIATLGFVELDDDVNRNFAKYGCSLSCSGSCSAKCKSNCSGSCEGRGSKIWK